MRRAGKGQMREKSAREIVNKQKNQLDVMKIYTELTFYVKNVSVCNCIERYFSFHYILCFLSFLSHSLPSPPHLAYLLSDIYMKRRTSLHYLYWVSKLSLVWDAYYRRVPTIPKWMQLYFMVLWMQRVIGLHRGLMPRICEIVDMDLLLAFMLD